MQITKTEERLHELGIQLPRPVAPAANYVPFVISDGWLYISGQVSTDKSGGIKGTVGEDLDENLGRAAARLSGLNILAQVKAACGGDLDKVKQVVKLNGFVQAGPTFWDIPPIINGASDLMVEVFGDRGRHSRTALGVYRLPRNFAVEVDALIRVAI